MPYILGMELKTYISEKRGRGVELATRLGVTPVSVHEWAVGKKRVPAERCPDIERATEGAITCEDLRPDLADQWAYLRNSRIHKTQQEAA